MDESMNVLLAIEKAHSTTEDPGLWSRVSWVYVPNCFIPYA